MKTHYVGKNLPGRHKMRRYNVHPGVKFKSLNLTGKNKDVYIYTISLVSDNFRLFQKLYEHFSEHFRECS